MPQAKPFLMIGALWLLLGLVISVGLSENWVLFLPAWVLGSLNLAVIAKLTYSLLNLERRSHGALFFWGLLKITCLGAIGLMLFHLNSVDLTPVLLGLGTLVVVPLGGGILWSRSDGSAG